MSSEISYSIGRSQKDEESSRPNVPIPTLGEPGGLEPTETQERPTVHRAKLAFSRALPRTYRVTSKALLYLRGPRPKRDLDRASCLVTPMDSRSNIQYTHPLHELRDLQHQPPSCI
jgi:hypothetical protein